MFNYSERALAIQEMHASGLTYKEIGKHFGISPQAAHQAAQSGGGPQMNAVNKVIFVGLRNWMLKNRMPVSELGRRIYVTSLYDSLYGKNDIKKYAIDAILKITGMTYEECFGEVELND